MSNGKDTTFFDQLMQGPSFDVKKKDEEEEEKSAFDQLMSGPSLDEEPTTPVEEEDKTFKDYVKQVGNFISKLPGFTADWGERFVSSALKMPKQAGQGAEQFNRNKKWIFDAVKWEYEKLGLSEESAEGLVNILQKVLPLPGKDIQLGFEVSEGVYDLVKDTDTFKSLEHASEKLYQKSDRYGGKGIVELAKQGDWMAASGAMVLFGAESLPQSIVAAAGGPGGAAALGLMVAGEKYDELLDREDMSENVRMINSNLIGILEAFTEYIGSVQIGKIFKDVLQKGGKKQLKDFAEKTGRNWMTRLWKKAGLWTAPIREGMEEFVNQFGENIVVKYTGEDPDREIRDDLLESTLRGFSGGGHFTGAGLTVQGIQKFTERLQKEKETRIGKPEEPKAKRTDVVETPEVTKKEPALPVYKIGEQVFESKDEFLSEAEKLKGQETIPEITIENDENTFKEIDKMFPETEIKKEEPSDAGKVGEEIKEAGRQEELVREEEERLRIRKLEEDRLETEPGKKAPREEVGEEIAEEKEAEGETIKAIESELASREKAVKSEAPYRVFGNTYKTKEDFLKAIDELDSFDQQAIWGDDIYGKDVTLPEIAKIAESKEGSLGAAPIEKASTKELVDRLARERERIKEAEEPEIEPEVSELATRSTEISKSFGLSGFRVTEGKKGKPIELAKEDIENWLNKEEAIELSKEVSDERKDKIREEFSQQRDQLREAGLRDVETMRDIMHGFIQRNRSTLGKIHGRAVPTMMSRINKAETITQLRNAMEYIADQIADVGYRKKMLTGDQIIKEVSPKKKLETKRGTTRAKASYINRLSDENIQMSKDITAQIERGDPDAVEQEIEELQERKEQLREDQADPEVIEAIDDQLAILEFGRMENMSQKQLDATLIRAKELNRLGRTLSKINRIASARKGSRRRKAINDLVGHPDFMAGSAKNIKDSKLRKLKQLAFTWDADFAALMNQLERGGGRRYRMPWDQSLESDNRRDINTSKLGEHKELYESINSDIETLKGRIEQGLEDNPFAEDIKKDLKDINKKTVENFIDKWHEHVSDETRQEIDNFTESIEEKYNFIRKNTDAWMKDTFSTGPLQRMFHTELIHKAEGQNAKDMHTKKREADESLEKIFGVKGGKLARKLIELQENPSVMIPHINEKGEVDHEPLTPMQALHKWLEYKMGDRMDNFTTPQERDNEGNIVGGMGWNQDSFDALEDAITPELSRLGDWLVSKYKEMINETQPAYLDQYGVELDLLDNYVTSLVVPNKYNGDHGTLLEGKDIVRGVSSDRFKKKTKNHYPLANVDALQMYMEYVSDMVNFKNMSEPIRQLEYTFFDKGVQNHIKTALGSEYNNQIRGFIDRWAGRSKRNNVKWLDNMMNNISRAVLGLKIAIGAKQTFSVIQYGADPNIGMPEFIARTTEMGIPTKLNRELLHLFDEQPYFADRIGAIRGLDWSVDPYSGTFDFSKDRRKQNVMRKGINKFKAKKAIANTYLSKQKADSFVMGALKYGDRFPAVIGGGAYLKMKYKHFSNGKELTSKDVIEYREGKANPALSRALDEWSIMSAATQQSTRTSRVSNLRASSSWARAFTQFTSGPAQLSRNTLNSIRNISRGKNIYGNLKSVVISSMVTGAMYAWADLGYKLDLDDEEKKEFLWKALIGPFKGVAIWGRVLSTLIDVRFDKPWARSDMTRISGFDQVYRSIEAAMKLGEGDLTPAAEDKYLQQLVESLATLQGIPADEMIDIYQVVEKAVEGEASVMELLMLRNPSNTKKVGSSKARYE